MHPKLKINLNRKKANSFATAKNQKIAPVFVPQNLRINRMLIRNNISTFDRQRYKKSIYSIAQPAL
ncbi:hypothetical protein IQ269_25505 [Tychonema sp. LEGE 07199]|uniref:hypothetical protein n=1 Tax=unclassified Tychonema TaxID=2642144 RepID=UPI0018822D5F|nr:MULTISPECIES: hypothetical protein [unclassified Tychonema]MBE9124065.1 hypothetical protein [Tychonema sp. LEGE 07199]MBE9135170.1 hypothetical protein [Tychonema sp. LEGE 07196]